MNPVAWPGWIARRPRWVLAFVLMLSLIAARLCVDPKTGALRFRIDPSVEALMPANDPGLAVLAQLRRTFGEDDPVIVAVRFETGVFSAQNLDRVDRLGAAFKALPGVRDVYSLATAPNLRAVGDELLVSSFTEQARAEPNTIETLPAQLAANPLYRGTLVSADGKSAAFALSTGALTPQEYLASQFDRQIRTTASQIAGEAPVRITGTLPVRAATSEALSRTLRFTVPAVFAVIAALLLLAFRSLRATLSALLTVSFALLWTLATAVLLRIDFNLVSAIVPPLVITIGLSYAIHLLAAHFLSRTMIADATAAQRDEWVMRRIGTGLLLSATTTVIGFLSLTLNALPAIREFAVLASIGTIYVGALTWLFLPALLNLTGCTREPPVFGSRLFARLAKLLATFDLRWRRPIIAIALLLILAGGWSASRIRTGTDFIHAFAPNSVVRQDFEAISKAFDGANLITIFVDTGADDALIDPQAVRSLDALDTWLRAQPEVGAVASYVDHLKLLNRAFNADDAAFFAVPDSAAAIKQMLVFGGGDALARRVDPRYRSAAIAVRIKVDGSIAIAAFLARLDAQLERLPAPLKAQATGSTVLATRAVAIIASGHLLSIAIAVGAIWALLSLMFMSVRAGLIATLPNLVPIAVYFGTLGVLGIPLDPTTSLIACVVLGIAVNDTVHFLARFNADARAQGSEAVAVRTALASVLRPITLATLALCLGFLVFTGSELRNQAQFGALAAWTLFVAWIADMSLTPALGSRLRIVTLWDLLRLDLGRSPQQTIPLLAGLSIRQARLFALMSRMETVAAGARLIQEGDQARDIYVIIDGHAEATIDRQGERRVLSSMTRGVVIGEAGFFGQCRTASVDAMTVVRLLRFDLEDMESLRRRYPKIAATVFRNLNRIQAERIARMTALVQ